MRPLLIAAALVAVSCPAGAQQSSKDALARLGIKIVEPMSAKELARTKERIAAELARAGAASFFEDISDANGGRARHRPSGLVCPLGKKGQQILAASADGASCETRGEGAVYRIMVQRANAGATTESAAAAALAGAQRQPGYAPGGGLAVIARPKPGEGPEHRTLNYVSRVNGRERAYRVQVGLVRGWILTEQRETKAGAQPNLMSDLLGEATFGLSMKQQ
jgi:hypothetical protein